MQAKIRLTGITDYRNAAAGQNRNDTLNGLKSQGSGKDDEYAGIPNIAFTHNPDIVEELPASLFDLVLCGHYHGGQIWAPFDLEFKMLRNDNLSRKGIKRGLHKVNGMDIYINRGLGNVLVPLRFMSRPEVTVFELTI